MFIFSICGYLKAGTEKKEGIWYKGKFWENYKDETIPFNEAEKLVDKMVENIKTAKALINDKEKKIEEFMMLPYNELDPDSDDDGSMALITAFKDMYIVIKIDEEDFEKDEPFNSPSRLYKGNIFSREEPKLLSEGELYLLQTKENSFKVNGSFKSDNKKYKIDMSLCEDLMGAGSTTVEVKGQEAFLNGVLGTITFNQIKEVIQDHPEVDTIVLEDVPGSMNDLVNVHTGRLIRRAGLKTKVLKESRIYSGAVDIFCSGVERVYTKGAEIGVHSWGGGPGGMNATDFPDNHPAHKDLISYLSEMLGDKGEGFYFYTIKAAPADGIHVMSFEDIKSWNIGTSFTK